MSYIFIDFVTFLRYTKKELRNSKLADNAICLFNVILWSRVGYAVERKRRFDMQKEYVNASFLKRGIAFVIDAIMAFLPALVVYFIFTGSYSGYTPLFYPAPVIGAVSMIDLPVLVDRSVSTIESDEGGVISRTNYSMPATGARMLSVFVIIIYVGYGTFCTAMYDGRTIGKKLMRLRVVPEDEAKPTRAYLLRELVGKVLVNSTIIVPVVSLFMVLFTPNKKSVHDYIGKTRVIVD